MDMFQQYKEMYQEELKTREALYSRLNIPLAIIFALVGLLSFYLKSCKMDTLTENYLFGVSVCIATVFFALAIRFFVSSFFGYTYLGLPTANEIEKHRQAYRRQLENFYKEHYPNDPDSISRIDDAVNKATKELLYGYYQKLSTVNGENNVRRSAYLHKVTKWLIVAAISYAVSALLFVVSVP